MIPTNKVLAFALTPINYTCYDNLNNWIHNPQTLSALTPRLLPKTAPFWHPYTPRFEYFPWAPSNKNTNNFSRLTPRKKVMYLSLTPIKCTCYNNLDNRIHIPKYFSVLTLRCHPTAAPCWHYSEARLYPCGRGHCFQFLANVNIIIIPQRINNDAWSWWHPFVLLNNQPFRTCALLMSNQVTSGALFFFRR